MAKSIGEIRLLKFTSHLIDDGAVLVNEECYGCRCDTKFACEIAIVVKDEVIGDAITISKLARDVNWVVEIHTNKPHVRCNFARGCCEKWHFSATRLARGVPEVKNKRCTDPVCAGDRPSVFAHDFHGRKSPTHDCFVRRQLWVGDLSWSCQSRINVIL